MKMRSLLSSVKIISIPDKASLVMDEKELGLTPIVINIEPGYHLIKLIKEGYKPIEACIEIPDSKIHELKFELKYDTTYQDNVKEIMDLIRQGNITQVRHKLEEFRDRFPNSKIIDKFEEQIKDISTRYETVINKARSALVKNEFVRAGELLYMAQKILPSSTQSDQLLKELRLKQQEIEERIEEIERYIKVNRWRDALNHTKQLLTSYPGNHEAINLMFRIKERIQKRRSHHYFRICLIIAFSYSLVIPEILLFLKLDLFLCLGCAVIVWVPVIYLKLKDFKMRRHKAIMIRSLIKRLGSPDQHTRLQAIEALGQTADRRVAKPLIDLLGDQDWVMRSRVAEALGQIADPCVVRSLTNLLEDPEQLVRWQATRALGKIANDQAVVPLIKALKDPIWSVRWQAVEVLGRIGATCAIEPLNQLLKDETNRFVRQSIQKVLKELKRVVLRESPHPT
jgi:tetratricopeptide (TPR) repeat protein